jgi:cardiolipin synthase
MSLTIFMSAIYYFVVAYILYRVMLRPYREPASRLSWIVIVIALPVVGILLYFMFGETSIGFLREKKMRLFKKKILKSKSKVVSTDFIAKDISPIYKHIFQLAHSINNFTPKNDNSYLLMEDSDAFIESLVQDIMQAKYQIHILFYIWLEDFVGKKVANALIEASQRGVKCRVLVDALGSRNFINSSTWKQMSQANLEIASSLSIGNPILRVILGRIDLRNHRKIVVIDNTITYSGSQNCADKLFSPKAQWVDTMVRFKGSLALQNQALFLEDWLEATNRTVALYPEDQPPLITVQNSSLENAAQVVGTGPTERYGAMSDMFQGIIATARRTLVITTPYFVPNEPVLNAICGAARMGVKVKLILPQKNDSWFVSSTSRSYYAQMLAAGVEIFEYTTGLLHAKILIIDDELSMIGSANLDRRSFELNYENNIIVHNILFAKTLHARVEQYILDSHKVSKTIVEGWSKPKILWHNLNATLSPLL